MKNLRKALVWSAVCVAAIPGVWAGSTIHVGPGAGSSCATGCGGDPNVLGGADNVDLYQNSGGAPACSGPVLVILGVPGKFNPRLPVMPITAVTATNTYPDGTQTGGTASFALGGTFGLKDPVSDGYFGNMVAGEEVYSFLGLPDTNNSNSFTNWSTADRTLAHVRTQSFAIHVYALDADLAGKGLVDLALEERVPKGTFVVGYCQDADGKTYSTPFTESGLKTGY